MEGGHCSNLFELASGNKGAWPARSVSRAIRATPSKSRTWADMPPTFLRARTEALASADSQTALRAVGPTFSDFTILDTEGMCCSDLTELSSYLPLVSSFEFGNVSGDGGPRPRTTMTSAGTAPWGPSMHDGCHSAPPGFESHLPFTAEARYS